MGKRKKATGKADTYKGVAHRAFMEALASGQRPARAATFTDRRKEASRKACRSFRHDD